VSVELRATPFSPFQEIEQYQLRSQNLKGNHGATASFIGVLRNQNAGDRVVRMFLEHYAGMTEKYLTQIRESAHGHWQLLDSLIIHRVGEIQCGDAIVVVAAWSSHRGDALDACRHMIEELKTRAPFWKRETLDDGSDRWVSHNTSGYAD